MERRRQNIIPVLLALLMAVLLPVQAFASTDTAQTASLTVRFAVGDDAVPARDVEFQIYRAADLSEDGTFTPCGAFRDYPVPLTPADADAWRDRAGTLTGYVRRDGLPPLSDGTTNIYGQLLFPDLTPGLYLVTGGQYTDGNVVYSVEPFLVSLPDEVEGEWAYDVIVAPKYTRHEIGETTSLRTLKVWADDSADDRPSSVTVDLMRGGTLYATVTLSAENDWRYQWDGLDAAAQWSLTERPVEGYTVTVSRQGAAFVVTNTGASGSDSPDTPDKPDDTKLPQTGALWWPVPVLLAAGLALVLIGCVRRRSDDAE